jgi:hypothetical protein
MLRIAVRGLVVLATLGIPALTLFACVQPPALVVETSTGDVVRLESWTAVLEPISSEMRGTATLEPGSTYRETRATVTISGAAPRSPHAWLIHQGACGHELGVLTGPAAYTPIAVNAEGAGTSTVTLPFTVPTSGRYSVTVRESELETSRAVACGNLTKSPLVGGPTIATAPAQ